MDSDLLLVGEHNTGQRKKACKPTKRDKAKRKRYADADPGLLRFRPPCAHHDDKFVCRTISREKLIAARAKIYREGKKTEQDNIAAAMLQVASPKSRKSRALPRGRNAHKFQIHYKLWSEDGPLNVCQKFFSSVTSFTHRRLLTIANSLRLGVAVKEKRGGDHKSHIQQRQKMKVREFISKLTAKESHYNRLKSVRLYLSSEWNINRLWKKYNSEVGPQIQVKSWLFRNIFRREFNIGFGSPASDTCSTCARLVNLVRIETDPAKKVKVMTDYRIHKLRAKQYHKMMGERPDKTMSYCFDLQQVQNLPKIPIGETFYARQLAYYAFCVTDISSTKPVFFTWTENLSGRGANEIASALYQFLSKLDIPEDIKTIRLFADGCAGQNKNSHIVHALMTWMVKKAPPNLKSILLVFPVRGHSYLPADRVFGRVESILRPHSEILLPEKYFELYSLVGEVRVLGKDWEVFNIKKLLSVYNKLVGISEMKRIMFLKTSDAVVKVKCEPTYRINDDSKTYESLTKRGKKVSSIVLESLSLARAVKKEKLRDVDNLLKKYRGAEWRQQPELAWYVECIDGSPTSTNVEDCEDDHDEQCNCLDEDIGLRV